MRVKKYPLFLSEDDIRFEYDILYESLGKTIGAIKHYLEEGDEEKLAELRLKERRLRKLKQARANILMKITVGEI